MPPRLSALYVEDDARLAAMVKEYLAKNEIDVTIAEDGERGLRVAERRPFDVVLLDVMLPSMDGLEVCRRLRARPELRALPILMLTAKGDDVDRIVGLELGADDYLPKPFNPRELLARIRAVLRRAGGGTAGGGEAARIRVGGLEIDLAAREVTVDGKRALLTHFEFELLAHLARAAGRVLSREHLMEALKGEELDSFDRTIDVHISRLRQKIEADPKTPRYVKTIRGVGYVLVKDAVG
jgi:DNA-binding response OmpR family regulator